MNKNLLFLLKTIQEYEKAKEDNNTEKMLTLLSNWYRTLWLIPKSEIEKISPFIKDRWIGRANLN